MKYPDNSLLYRLNSNQHLSLKQQAIKNSRKDEHLEIEVFKMSLLGMTLEELKDQYGKKLDIHKQQKINIEEKSQLWNIVSATLVDFEYWSKMPYWSIEEGIALLLRRNPRVVTYKLVNNKHAPSSVFKIEYMDIYEIARRSSISIGENEIGKSNSPKSFLNWAKINNFKIPNELKVEVVKRNDKPIDYKNLFNSAIINIEKLEAEKKTLLQQLTNSNDNVNHQLHPKEKTNWGRIVKILLAQLDSSAEKPHKVAEMIQHIADTKGIKSPSETTIVTRLKELPDD